MRSSELTGIFKADRQKVWDVMTNNKDYEWRSDVERIEIVDDITFKEYDKKGNCTTFTITKRVECEIYEFNMKNKRFKGNWTGKFARLDKGTQVVFTENIKFRNPIWYLLSFLFMDLGKMQKQYIYDLKAKVEKE